MEAVGILLALLYFFVSLFAFARLFSIDATLKAIHGRLVGQGQSLAGVAPASAPAEKGAGPPKSAATFVVALVLILVGLIAAVAFIHSLPSRIEQNEASATASMRSIVIAVMAYEALYERLPESLEVLGPPLGGSQPGPSRADLLDSFVASGEKAGYLFELALKPKARGRPAGFEVTAAPKEPKKSGLRTFYADESGVIRWGLMEVPADSISPPI